MARPQFDPRNGRRIRYSDSQVYDENGNVIPYGEDHSDCSMYDQVTGLPRNVDATIQVTQHAPQAAPQGQNTQAPAVTVTRVADQAYEAVPVYDTLPGQTIRQIRGSFRHSLNLTDTMDAYVNGQLKADNDTVIAGNNVTFRERSKKRG